MKQRVQSYNLSIVGVTDWISEWGEVSEDEGEGREDKGKKAEGADGADKESIETIGRGISSDKGEAGNGDEDTSGLHTH